MTSLLDKLNLRPAERRLVVVVAMVVIAALYFFFIWPQFSELAKLQKRKQDIETDLTRFQREIDRTAAYQVELRKLKEKGTAVDSEAQALDMQRYVNSQAAMSAVSINSYSSGRNASSSGGKTNAFFEEQTGTIQFVAEENALVGFLYSLSSGSSLIRVSSMTLNPDPSQTKLMGNMTLVASYPKKAVAKTPSVPAPGSKPIAVTAPRAPGSPTAPKSISAALSGPKVPATNTPAAPSMWSKFTGLFSSSPGTNAPAKTTNAPVKAPAPGGPPKK